MQYSKTGDRPARFVPDRYPLIGHSTTSVEDVVMAYRVLLGRPPADSEDLERLRLSQRSLLELQQYILQSDEMATGSRRRAERATSLDQSLVQAAYRLLRFEDVPPDRARAEAAEGGTLSELVNRLLASSDSNQARLAAAPRPSDGVLLLHGKSMPRSGHHLLANMLCEYYQERLAYCEYYTVRDCCRSMPCQRPMHPLLQNRFMLQKSHDLLLTDPTDSAGIYLIQYRHPIPRLQSNYDHSLHVRGGEDTFERFRDFAKADTMYYIGFWEKWISRPPPGAIVLTYEELARSPQDTIERVVSCIVPEEDLDRGGRARALTVLRVPSGSSQVRSGPVTAREIGKYRHYDATLYREIEQEIFEACPGLPFTRVWTEGSAVAAI